MVTEMARYVTKRLLVRNNNFNYKHTSFDRLIEQYMVDRRSSMLGLLLLLFTSGLLMVP